MMLYLLLAVGCLSAGNSWAETVEQAALSSHNNYRSIEANTEQASNMYKLVWDDSQEGQAERWAERCDFSHDSPSTSTNLYYSTPANQSADYYMHSAVDTWWAEKKLNINGSFDCCSVGLSCCNYTQVVWAKTRRLGCAVHTCDTLSRYGVPMARDAAFVVCYYEPIGNVMVNWQLPVYKHGVPCSACDPGDGCSDGLCVAASD